MLADPAGTSRYLGETSGATFLDTLKELIFTATPLAKVLDGVSVETRAGAAFLAKYYGHFRDWPKTVAAYNWGIGNLHNWLQGDTRVGPDDETQTMLKHVFRGDPHAFNKKP